MPLIIVRHTHDHYYHTDVNTAQQLRRIENMLGEVLNNQENTMSLIDDLSGKLDAATASIQKNSDLDDSILAALAAETQSNKDLRDALAAAGTDPVKLQAVLTAMDALIAKSEAEAQKKADAITANTSAATP